MDNASFQTDIYAQPDKPNQVGSVGFEKNFQECGKAQLYEALLP